MTMTTNEGTPAETADYIPSDSERYLASDAFLISEQPIVERIDITPWVAEQWLARNMHNRSISERFVSLYTHDLINGRWVCNGDTFKFDVAGELIDGQHRANMIVATSITLPGQFVVRGLPVEARKFLDAGKPRSVPDVLTINGMDPALAKKVATTTTAVIQWESGFSHDPYTRADAVRFAETFEPALVESSLATAAASSSLKLMPGMLAALHFLVTHGPTDLADTAMFDHDRTMLDHLCIADFVEALSTGAGLDEDDPALTFRNWYLRVMRDTNRPTMAVRWGALVTVWNAWALGEPMARMRLPRLTGRDALAFPALVLSSGSASAAVFGTEAA